MLDYAGLEALAAVLREGSFERAARRLHVTPSAVSQRIKQLEERAGQVLVQRGSPCTGTDAGRRLCLHLEQVRLLRDEGLTILLAEQGVEFSLALADRVYVLEKGSVRHSGPAEELRQDRALRDSLLTI